MNWTENNGKTISYQDGAFQLDAFQVEEKEEEEPVVIQLSGLGGYQRTAPKFYEPIREVKFEFPIDGVVLASVHQEYPLKSNVLINTKTIRRLKGIITQPIQNYQDIKRIVHIYTMMDIEIMMILDEFELAAGIFT